jgi:hypothetical protein
VELYFSHAGSLVEQIVMIQVSVINYPDCTYEMRKAGVLAEVRLYEKLSSAALLKIIKYDLTNCRLIGFM